MFSSQLVERYILKQPMGHCNRNNLLPDFQSAYRKHYSTKTSLLKIVSDILWNFERQNLTTVVIFDLSATFDTIDHDVLLMVLTLVSVIMQCHGLKNTYNQGTSKLHRRQVLMSKRA